MLGRFEEAETHLRRAIALNPQEKYAHFNLGNTLCEQGRFEEALEAARVAVEQRPDFARAHTTLSIALTALGRFEEAEAHLRRAIALDPRTQNVHLNLGMTLYYQGRFEEALDAARVAVEQHPDFALAHVNLGLGSQCAGTLRGGRNSSAPCLGTQPARCILFPEIDRNTHATGTLRRSNGPHSSGSGISPGLNASSRVTFSHGETARENGQPEAAAEYYEHTLEMDPHYAKALHWLATLRAQQQRYGEMLELLQRLIALHPNDAATYSNMGIALVFLGRNDEALQRFDQAFSLDPTLENVRANREALLETMKGDTE